MNNNNYDNYNHNNKKARYKTIKVMDYLKNLFNPQKWSGITWKQCCKEAESSQSTLPRSSMWICSQGEGTATQLKCGGSRYASIYPSHPG